jgi:cell division protein FtsB
MGNIRTEPQTIGGGISTGRKERCTALLKQGSLGYQGVKESQPGDHCKRLAVRNGLCWTHLKFGGMLEPEEGRMQRFRKKPVVIEAVQFVGSNRQEIVELVAAATNGVCVTSSLEGPLTIGTLEGNMTASIGDWVIRGVKGEFYPCKPDIFAATYEAAPIPPAGEAEPPKQCVICHRVHDLANNCEEVVVGAATFVPTPEDIRTVAESVEDVKAGRTVPLAEGALSAPPAIIIDFTTPDDAKKAQRLIMDATGMLISDCRALRSQVEELTRERDAWKKATGGCESPNVLETILRAAAESGKTWRRVCERLEGEKVAAEARVSELSGLLPSSYYADRTLEFRIKQLVDEWRRLAESNQTLEQQVSELSGQNERMRASLARMLDHWCDSEGCPECGNPVYGGVGCDTCCIIFEAREALGEPGGGERERSSGSPASSESQQGGEK